MYEEYKVIRGTLYNDHIPEFRSQNLRSNATELKIVFIYSYVQPTFKH